MRPSRCDPSLHWVMRVVYSSPSKSPGTSPLAKSVFILDSKEYFYIDWLKSTRDRLMTIRGTSLSMQHLNERSVIHVFRTTSLDGKTVCQWDFGFTFLGTMSPWCWTRREWSKSSRLCSRRGEGRNANLRRNLRHCTCCAPKKRFIMSLTVLVVHLRCLGPVWLYLCNREDVYDEFVCTCCAPVDAHVYDEWLYLLWI